MRGSRGRSPDQRRAARPRPAPLVHAGPRTSTRPGGVPALAGTKVLTQPRNGPAAPPAWQKGRHARAADGRAGNRQARRAGALVRGRALLARTALNEIDRSAPTAPERRAGRATGSPRGRSAPGQALDLSSSRLTPGSGSAPVSFTGAQRGHAGQGRTAPSTPRSTAHHSGCGGDRGL